MSTVGSGTSWKSSDGVPDQFPAGLRVLVVDDDPTCLRILEKMLRNCLYEVTKCNRAEIALQYLRDNKNGFDVVISDVHMPDMDGFKLLEQVGLEMDLPVIMMSADDSKNVVMKGVTHGACDYLIKPVRMEALKNIWQHVVRKRKNDWKDKDFEQRGDRDFEQSGSVEEGGERKHNKQQHLDDADYSSSANEGNWKTSRKRKEEEDEGEDNDDTSTMKKPRVVWSVELHQQFVAAVNQLGIDKAVPKKILELMNVPGLTRENVASHLQKYRLYLRRLSGVSQHQNGMNGSFMGPADASFAAMSSLHGFDFQALATSQIPPQSLASLQAAALCRPPSKSPLTVVDSRNLFSFKSPKLLGNNNNNTEQMNLLHGIPTNMEPKQLASLSQSVQVNSQVCENSPRIMQMNSRAQMLNEITSTPVSTVPSSVGQPILLNGLARSGGSSANGIYTGVSQGSPMVDFSMNNGGSQLLGNSYSNVRHIGPSSLTSKGMMMMQGEVVNLGGVKKSRGGFVPNHEFFNEPQQQQYRSTEWGLQNVGGPTFDPVARGNVEVLPSTYVQPGLSSAAQKSWQDSTGEAAMFSRGDGGGHHNSNSSFGLPLNPFVADNSSRIKVENLQDVTNCPSNNNNLFAQPFGQDDIFNALLKQQQDGIGTIGTEFGFDGYTLDNLSA